MGARKLSFRLLSALAGAVFVLLAACSSSTPTPDPRLVIPESPLCGEESTDMHIWRVTKIEKYRSLLRHQPGYDFITVGYMKNKGGEWTSQRGIIVRTRDHKPANQIAIPPHAGIPDCPDGVPVQIIGSNQRLHPSWEQERLDSRLRQGRLDAPPKCAYDTTFERSVRIHNKYFHKVLMEYPNVRSFGVSDSMIDGDGNVIEMAAHITVYLTDWVDPDTVPPELRIPDCLEGIPVLISVIRFSPSVY